MTADRVVIAVALHNAGNVVVRAPVTFLVENAAGEELATADAPAVVVLPGTTRVVEMPLAVSAATASRASALIRFGPAAEDRTTDTCAVTDGERPLAASS